MKMLDWGNFVSADENEGHMIPMARNRTRWLAILAGGISGIAGVLPYGLFWLLIPSILILGVIVQRWSPSPGRWLMWLGAFLLTLNVGLFLAPALLEIRSLRSTHDVNLLAVIVLALASVVLVGWCDVALVVDARRSRSAREAVEPSLPRPADRIVWIVALCLSAFVGWDITRSVVVYREYGRLNILLIAIVIGIAVAFLDAKLIIQTIKGRRLQRSRNVEK